MARNGQIERQWRLWRLLAMSKAPATAEDLADRLGGPRVASRTVRRDLATLRHVSVPVRLVRDGRTVRYCITDDGPPLRLDLDWDWRLPDRRGVVSVEAERSFVLADIPGLIEGASQGAGLGTRFLRHLARTRLLLHLVDLAPVDEHDVARDVRTVEAELKDFSADLAARPRWLVLNKIDALDEQERSVRRQRLVDSLGWEAPVFEISAVSGEGCGHLCRCVMGFLDESEPAEQAL